MNLKKLFLLSVFAFGVSAGALEQARAATKAPLTSPTAVTEEARNRKVEPADVVSIIVEPAEEYSRDVTILPDFKIELPLIGSLNVRDMTPRQLEQLLEERYGKYVENPKVTVTVRAFSGRKVAILGESRGQGFFPYRDGMKMLELVTLAGGLSEVARTNRVMILRQGTGPKGMSYNFQKVLDGDLNRDLLLLPGDTVIVPKTVITKKAQWITINILPWLSFATLATSVALLAQ